MGTKREQPPSDEHAVVEGQYDAVQNEGQYEEGMARMAVYHRYCQDPVLFRTLGDIRGMALLDLACGDGFYTRRFRSECGADRVLGIDLSAQQIDRAQALEKDEPLGIEYRVGDVIDVDIDGPFDVATAIHLLHYLQSEAEIESALRRIFHLLKDDSAFVTMIANPEFDLEKHDASDSKSKFGYYFSLAEPGNGGLLRFHPGGFEKERELTFELRRWKRSFIEDIANSVGFTASWHEPFISAEGLQTYGVSFFENFLASPQSVLLRLVRRA